MAVPALPRSHFILVKPNLTFPCLKTLFYCPSISNGFNHLLEGSAHWCKDQHIGSFGCFFSHFHSLPYHQKMAPSSNSSILKFNSCPIIETRSFAPSTCAQALPIIWSQSCSKFIHPVPLSCHDNVFFTSNC